MRYRIGTYNVRKGRNPKRVAREIRRLFRRGRLHSLNVQEFATQHAAVVRLLPDHLVVMGYPDGDISARDSAVIVDTRRLGKCGRSAGGTRLHRLEREGWERAPHNRDQGLHNPRSAVSARVGQLRAMSVHMPPGPHSWPLRGEAFDTALDTVENVLGRWSRNGRPWVAFGDWNKHINAREIWRMARRLDATREGDEIDYLLAGPGVAIKRVWRPKWAARITDSDHDPVFAVVEVD